jgi:hypothetical protein
MKTVTDLSSNWVLKRIDPVDQLDISHIDAILAEGQNSRDKLFAVSKFPAQIYDVLIAHKIIENPNITGDASACQWAADSDWVYKTEFDYSLHGQEAYFDFLGLDTYADIYLNGEKIAEHEDVYLPNKINVPGKLLPKNQLVVHFHSPRKKLNEVRLPDYIPDRELRIRRSARTRLFGDGFGDYLGLKPCLPRVGIYDSVLLTSVDSVEITHIHTPYVLAKDLDAVTLTVELNLKGSFKNVKAKVFILDPDNKLCAMEELIPDEDKKAAAVSFTIERPSLWWPRTHGKSPLYIVRAELYDGNSLADRAERKIGFRTIERIGDFDFTINGLPLKLYGSNLAPVDTTTNVYNRERMNGLLDLVELSHQNCLRVWGQDERLHEAFYEECDRRGILIWQDFFTCYSMYDPNPHMLDLLRKEAEYQVMRLRDHPCIWLWCGGNESIMSAQFDFPGEEMIGIQIFDELFPEVCYRLDPGRYYHRSSPDGGAYPNDPLGGDTHGYTHIWFVPGSYYPVFLSENNRVSTPAKRTMKRMMKEEDLWPEAYDGLQHKNNELPWPEQWNKYNSNQGYWKLGEIESYYDATDLDSMLYRIGWAHGDYLRRRIERYRRGRPAEDTSNQRISKGHILWLLNAGTNHIFFNVVDYFLEPYIAYYSLKRAYEPVLLSFDTGNFINLWIINDSIRHLSGKVYIRLFSPQKNSVLKNFEMPFVIKPDESRLLTNLNQFGQFKSNNILHAYAVTNEGELLAETFDYVDIERHMRFPTDGTISLDTDNGDLLLCSNRYERSVELLGDDKGDEFGWLFDDNYFDLIPGRVKRVKILGNHNQGTITAKGYYSDNSSKIAYRRH